MMSARTSDKFIFVATLMLVVFGVIMIYSASSVLAAERYGNQSYFLIRQTLWAAVGLTAMLITIHINYHLYQKPWFVFLALLACLGLLVAVIFTPAVNNTHRWLRWRFISFQPAEAAKLSLMIFLAYYLSKRIPNDVDNFWKTFVPCAVVAGLVMALVVLERDLGMTILIAGIFVTASFVAGVPLRHIMTLVAAALPPLYYLLFHVSWRLERMLVFLDPWRDPLGRGFQAIQSQVAIGSGGVFGVGFAQGKQKLFYLPAPHTDFIFAHIGEELGLIGLVLLVAIFGLFFWRGLRLSLRAPDTFGALLGVSIITAIVAQALFNMSVTLGLLPVTGMTLPLISYGGTSLLMTLLQIGILLNITQHARAHVT